MKIVLWSFGVACVAAAFSCSTPSQQKKADAIQQDSVHEILVINELLKAAIADEKLNELLEQTIYKHTHNSVVMRTELFKRYGDLFNKAEKFKNQETDSLAEVMEQKTVAMQKRELPKMRKAYVEELGKILSTYDVYCSVSGKDNEVIEFAGTTFKSSMNAEEYNKEHVIAFLKLRFKKSVFRLSKNAPERFSYKLNTPADSELYSSEDD
ncbi:hypothetical protein [Rhodoflexus caldus]|uniref:hypothetical protein n=1 Tax=Rhodoflexus caldus TaxID=2891236 RepID=UPI002029FB0A|nr:hypothetical protein [Rhodoflexus caldus]